MWTAIFLWQGHSYIILHVLQVSNITDRAKEYVTGNNCKIRSLFVGQILSFNPSFISLSSDINE
jgi:hypothetical protein